MDDSSMKHSLSDGYRSYYAVSCLQQHACLGEYGDAFHGSMPQSRVEHSCKLVQQIRPACLSHAAGLLSDIRQGRRRACDCPSKQRPMRSCTLVARSGLGSARYSSWSAMDR